MLKKYLIRYLQLAIYTRSECIRKLGWLAIKKLIRFENERSLIPKENTTRIIFGGDVCFDPEIRILPFLGVHGFYHNMNRVTAIKRIGRKIIKKLSQFIFIPGYASDLKRQAFQEPLIKNAKNEKRKFETPLYKNTISFSADCGPEKQCSQPFKNISSLFKSRDLTAVNLETPLTSKKRAHGFFIAAPEYAQAMKDAGISIVSLANNHIFDAGEIGFLDTMRHLDDAKILYTGGGKNLEEARLGRQIEINDTKIAFLSYTQWCTHRFSSIAADYPGILPLDRQLIAKDIEVARIENEIVIICLHWGYEDQPNVHPVQVEIAHFLIDKGAHAIIGHHPHVPHGIEIYKGNPILYSLGNLIFRQADVKWTNDNFLAEFVINKKKIQEMIIYPISGKHEELSQPKLLKGERAVRLLYELQLKSFEYGTKFGFEDYQGHIKIH